MGRIGGAKNPRFATSLALGASLLVHATVIALSVRFLRAVALPPTEPLVDVALADMIPHGDRLSIRVPEASTPWRPPSPDAEPRSSGPLREPHPDTRTRGRGGAWQAAEKALHMSDSIDGVTLETDPTEFARTSQLSRLNTSADRRSREDRRTTPEPTMLTFIAMGPGTRVARLDAARTDPAMGARGAVPVPSGVRAGEPELEDGPARFVRGGARDGAAPIAPLGVDRGTHAAEYRRTAAVTLARPAVRQARASIATTHRGRPNDDVASSQEVATLVESLITASTAGGKPGRGPGGTDGDAAPGKDGAAGAGMRERSSGEGGLDSRAAPLGVENYAAALTRKVYPFWEEAFPIWARVEGRGGVAVIGVTLSPDGSVHDLRVVRGSGIPEFDRNVARALSDASPYGPLPRALRRSGLTLNIAFDALNPAVGRSGPGPGQR